MEKKIKILCIEDEPPVRSSLKDLLENSGYIVFTACNGNEGINLINQIIPNLIICDIMLPGISGYQILEKTLENEETKKIPFIFLTALSDMSDLRTGMTLGADDYITKPFKASDLLKSIKTRLKKSGFSNDNKTSSTTIKNYPKQFIIDTKNKPIIIKTEDITYIEAVEGYSKITLRNSKTITYRMSLKEWMQMLNPEDFIRINRSTIINIDDIDYINRKNYRSLYIYLKISPDPFRVSQRNLLQLKANYFL